MKYILKLPSYKGADHLPSRKRFGHHFSRVFDILMGRMTFLMRIFKSVNPSDSSLAMVLIASLTADGRGELVADASPVKMSEGLTHGTSVTAIVRVR